jgi:hypothetical protein
MKLQSSKTPNAPLRQTQNLFSGTLNKKIKRSANFFELKSAAHDFNRGQGENLLASGSVVVHHRHCLQIYGYPLMESGVSGFCGEKLTQCCTMLSYKGFKNSPLIFNG